MAFFILILFQASFGGSGINQNSCGGIRKVFILHKHNKIRTPLLSPYETLVRLILPEGILEYFELTNVTQTETGLNIYLEEKNIVTSGT
ncbi:hypothetical protein SAMN05216524_102371 [Mucilaginibacter sp. OK098]|nr:hypothetical protein SAMN05216524_102371 [Mucilaginibacter sp. OK098]